MTNLEDSKWLWEKGLTTAQRAELVSSIVVDGDTAAMKWLWGKGLTTAQRAELFRGIAVGGDTEAMKWLMGGDLTTAQRNKLVSSIAASSMNNKKLVKTVERNNNIANFKYDVFIAHASDDKDFVRNLANGLLKQGLEVWYDEFTLKLGDSLRRSIDHGLANSRYGIVVLSPSFFQKEWPQKELDGLVSREDGKSKVILPIWHEIDKEQVRGYSPTLADRVAVSSSKDVNFVIKEILDVVKDGQE